MRWIFKGTRIIREVQPAYYEGPMEYARVMSRYEFKHTLKFAAWNREENGLVGSRSYAEEADNAGMDIQLDGRSQHIMCIRDGAERPTHPTQEP